MCGVGGRCLETGEPAPSFPLVPVLGTLWNQTPPSTQPSSVYSKQFSLLPRLPSHPSQTLPPRSPFARQDSPRTNAARHHQPPHPAVLARSGGFLGSFGWKPGYWALRWEVEGVGADGGAIPAP